MKRLELKSLPTQSISLRIALLFAIAYQGCSRSATPSVDTGKELAATLSVDASKVIRQIPHSLYGANLDWVYDAGKLWDSQTGTFRADTEAEIENLHVGPILFPAGISADFYHWRDGIGPRSSRPVRAHGSDPDQSPNQFGTDELMQLCRRAHTRPVLLVNILTGNAEEAADWVRYCNASGNQERARNGSPDPYGVREWVVGNEPYMKGYSDAQRRGHMAAEDYIDRFLQYAAAMRKADPNIKLLAPAGENFHRYKNVDERNWNKALLQRAGSQIDLLSVHDAYAPVISGKVRFEDVYKAMFAFPEQVRENIQTLDNQIKEFAPGRARDMKLAITEWGPFFAPSAKESFLAHTKTLGSAIYVARALQVFIRSERVEMANFFKLTDLSFQGLIGFNGVPKATYYALQMYTTHFGNALVESADRGPTFDSPAVGGVDAAKDVPFVSSVASLNEGQTRLYVLCVNTSFRSPVKLHINVRGFNAGTDAKRWTLTASSVDANNGQDLPSIPGLKWPKAAKAPKNSMFDQGRRDEVTIKQSDLPGVASEFDVVLPPLSVTSFEMEKKHT